MAESRAVPEVELSEEKVSPVEVLVCGKDGWSEERTQGVIREQPVTLYYNDREMVTLLCAGHHLDELAAGFFYGEGFLESPDDIEKLEVEQSSGKVRLWASGDSSMIDQLWMKRTVTSGCGKGSLFYYAVDALLAHPIESDLTCTPAQVWQRMEDLSHLSETYKRTHGVHNSLLVDPNKIILFREDIGRHNAVDMLIGHAFLNRISLHDKILMTTGRLTSEILIKSAKVGIPVLISRNTATTLAIELAKSLNITLIGYARAGKFTVYSGRQRIEMPAGGER